MDERDVERRFERRAGRRLVVGAIVGTVVGAIAGLLVGMIVFRPWTGGDLAMALAGAILLGGVGGVWGGLAGLEPADPGREPLERADPLRDERWTVPERDERDGAELPESQPESRRGEAGRDAE